MIQDSLRGSLSTYVQQNGVFQWSLSEKGKAFLRSAGLEAAPATTGDTQQPLAEGLQGLGTFELQVLWYFKENPGDKVRYAANVLGVEAREINQLLYGPLKGMCTQDQLHGWSVTDEIRSALQSSQNKREARKCA